ncbi:hypothetical protein AB6A40_007927 [Gnathostoma spinigerum]|uniref:INTS8 TPR repeats domain-containing protein n=1 Tax=Gnathostoma spinigerum TaxID=75299 RepID=A0ABD6EMM9_9BILA
MCNDVATAKRVAESAWWQVMYQTFEEPSGKRRGNGSAARESTKVLLSKQQFLDFLRLVKEPRTIAFMLSFLAKLYNSTASGESSANIFIEHSDYWSKPFDGSALNVVYLSECLETTLNNAMRLNPINAFWLRAYADFKYARGQYNDAFVLYMETCVACSDCLTRLLPDNVVDDMMWVKVQRCLREGGFITLAAIVCQLMRDPAEHYVESAKAIVDSGGITLDVCVAYAPLIYDLNLVEFLVDAFERLGFSRKAELFLKGISVQETNSSNSPMSHDRWRRRENFLRVLCAHAFQIHS